MNVILACLSAKYIHATLAPWCLKAGIEAFCKENIRAKVWESTINCNLEEYISSLLAQNPDFLCFSVYIWNREKTLEICKKIKKVTSCPILVGGPEVAYCPQDILKKYPFIDFVLSGEGEETLPLFLDRFLLKRDLSQVPGLSFRENTEIKSVPEKEMKGTPVSPYTEDYFQQLNGRISYLETSRGCPFSCAFCLSGRCSPLRFFDLEETKKRILLLANGGSKTIKLVDRTFNASPKRTNEILSFLLEEYGKRIPHGVCFHFEIAGDLLTEETITLLKEAPKGYFQMEIGIQSFHEKTLTAIHRKTNLEKLKQNIQALIGFENIHIHIDLIAGLTEETAETFQNSFHQAYSLSPHMLQLGFLKLLHGADMRENPEKYPCRYHPDPPYEVLETPWLSPEDIKTIKSAEEALERMYNSGRFLLTLAYLQKEGNLSPFAIFSQFGVYFSGEKASLSQYALKIFEYFKDFVSEKELKDTIICDLFSSLCESDVPKEWFFYSPLFKKIKKKFREEQKGSYRLSILPGSGKIFVVDPNGEKDLRGRIQGCFYDCDDFI